MPLNPRLLKKLNDADTVAAAGRKAIIREEYNSLRSQIRSITTNLLSPTTYSVRTQCNALRSVLDELEALDQLVHEESAATFTKESINED